MLAGLPDSLHLLLLLEKIRDPAARDAFHYMVGWAATLRDYECFPSRHGAIHDFRFHRGTHQDFAFIPNRKWLLFYFRRPCLKLPGFAESELRKLTPAVKRNSKNEWTVKVADVIAAKSVAAFIQSATSGPP